MKILNFGAMNIDLVYSVEHICLPGETIHSANYLRFAGGKGQNQSVALGKAGAEVFHLGKIGFDGDFLLDVLKEASVDIRFVSKCDSPSGNALIQVDKKGQNCIILFGGANALFSEKEIDNALASFEKGDILLLQNETNNVEYIFEKALEKGLEVAFNPSPMTDKLLSLPLAQTTYLILNEIEGAALANCTENDEVFVALCKKFPTTSIVLTLGKHGAVCRDHLTGEIHKNGIYDTPVVDTTGAGDTFTGFYLASISAGKDAKTALKTASVASSIAVSRAGAATAIPTLNEVVTSTYFNQ